MADKICILLLAITCVIQTLWIRRIDRDLHDLVEDWEGEE